MTTATPPPDVRPETFERLRAAVGQLSTEAVRRMDRDMSWFRDLDAQERTWIGSIVQAGVAAFVDWYTAPHEHGEAAELRAQVFGNAPRAFAGRITLQRTVAMVRLTIDVVEANLVQVLGEEDARPVLEAVTRYGREVAFATAEVYARAAELRGAWDARLEALVVDSVLRGETEAEVESRASALGWEEGRVVVLVGPIPPARRGQVTEDARRVAQDHDVRVLCAVQGDRLVIIVGRLSDRGPLDALAAVFGEGPVVVGPAVEGLNEVPVSADAALAGYRSAPGWYDAPRPVAADDLLPERALSGDERARRHLVEEIHAPLVAAGGSVLDTLAAYLEGGRSLEGTGRALFVHANTVRYRLRRAHEVSGLDPADARDAYTLRVALTVGRLVADGRGPSTDL
ncbi:PucR family transcriptional regulator [Marmoricola endophyticus]|uniref:PucR family transcriptional regulator n=1 Tax=Marmoricola endophyticus TaxID=2040280 RepID=A0A917BU06_9ACTN|nr:helix-turn-helix domain-containing protein [Marmoricola endophyticus]GGF58655.1 PucR family transcriptional regulator [Marmoricola endophyticus]